LPGGSGSSNESVKSIGKSEFIKILGDNKIDETKEDRKNG
jgi:hypothetical protein